MILWSSQTGPTTAGVYGQLFDSTGSQIGSEFEVTPLGGDPTVSGIANGGFAASWGIPDDGDIFGVAGQTFDQNAAMVGSSFQVNTYTTSLQGSPSQATLSNGNYAVTWESYGQDGSSAGIYSQVFSASGAKVGGEFQVNDFTTNTQWQASVSAFADSKFVVTWTSDDQDGSQGGIFGRVIDSNNLPAGTTSSGAATTLSGALTTNSPGSTSSPPVVASASKVEAAHPLRILAALGAGGYALRHQ